MQSVFRILRDWSEARWIYNIDHRFSDCDHLWSIGEDLIIYDPENPQNSLPILLQREYDDFELHEDSDLVFAEHCSDLSDHQQDAEGD